MSSKNGIKHQICARCSSPFLCKKNSIHNCLAKTNECECYKCYTKRQLGHFKLSFNKQGKYYRAVFTYKKMDKYVEEMVNDLIIDCWLLTKEEKELFVLEVL